MLKFKILFICCLMLVCMMLAVGCADNIGSDATPTDITPGTHNTEVVVPSGDDYPTLNISSKNEYEKLLKSEKLPADFVGYDRLEQFGTFKSMVFLTDVRYGDYGQYLYVLVDEATGEEMGLYVFHEYSDSKTDKDHIINITVDDVDSADMSELQDKSEGVKSFSQNGIKYSYVNGNLSSITWEEDGITYTLGLTDFKKVSTEGVVDFMKLETSGKAASSVKKTD